MMSRAAISFAIISLAAGATLAQAAGSVTSYTADPIASRLEFAGNQAGAEFKGVFHKFAAAIDFAPNALSSSHFDVKINISSLDTKDKDRDQTMRGPDIFDVARFPTARYVTRSLKKVATGYSATGALTLHGITKEVPLDFRFVTTPGAAKLEGTAKFKRLDFSVGQGEWKSTEWVGNEVKVAFTLVLKPKP